MRVGVLLAGEIGGGGMRVGVQVRLVGVGVLLAGEIGGGGMRVGVLMAGETGDVGWGGGCVGR